MKNGLIDKLCMLAICCVGGMILAGCLSKTNTIVEAPGTKTILLKAQKVTALVPNSKGELVESTLTLPEGSICTIGQPKEAVSVPVKK
jgi:hypothetical protein